MLTTAELDAMRETSASALPATCTITRPTGDPTFNPTTGEYDVPAPQTIYTGACRIRTLSTQDINVLVGDLHETLGRYICTLPHTATGIEVDDFLTVTAGTDEAIDEGYDEEYDADYGDQVGLVGRSFRITDVRWSEWHIDRRLVLEDKQQP